MLNSLTALEGHNIQELLVEGRIINPILIYKNWFYSKTVKF